MCYIATQPWPKQPHRRRTPSGFTLIEAMYATIIVGLGIVALMMLMASGTRVNACGNRLSTAVFLADELRSMTDDVAFEDLLDYDGQTFNGVDANGNALDGLAGYQQRLDVIAVDPITLIPLTGPIVVHTVRVTATVTDPDGDQTRFSWLRSD